MPSAKPSETPMASTMPSARTECESRTFRSLSYARSTVALLGHARQHAGIQVRGVPAFGEHELAALGDHAKGARRQNFRDFRALLAAGRNAEEEIESRGSSAFGHLWRGRRARRV